KEYVIEKDRKKEILANLKTSNKLMSNYNKEREAKYKTFKKLNFSHETSREDLVGFFDKLYKERMAYQKEMVDERLAVLTKIKADEWDSIMVFSKISLDKQIEKAQKKLDKNKEKGKEFVPFVKTRKAITDNVLDSDKQQILKSGLDKMISSIEELTIETGTINANESNLLINQNATKDELLKLGNKLNDMRRLIFDELIDFHLLVKENTNITEWDKIMKAFNKELSITPN
ncbi:MAG: hypothetical protein K8R74_06340, partial [Bacteroidales bacterium]|nr:hypothetical protein [Bacteroidales bacterium]